MIIEYSNLCKTKKAIKAHTGITIEMPPYLEYANAYKRKQWDYHPRFRIFTTNSELFKIFKDQGIHITVCTFGIRPEVWIPAAKSNQVFYQVYHPFGLELPVFLHRESAEEFLTSFSILLLLYSIYKYAPWPSSFLIMGDDGNVAATLLHLDSTFSSISRAQLASNPKQFISNFSIREYHLK